MAKCEICGKGPRVGYNVSHAHNRTKRTFRPNIQKVKTIRNGTVRRIHVCTRCLRSGFVEKPALRATELHLSQD